MSAMFWRIHKLTPGERSLVMAYITVSLFGAVLALTAVVQLGQGAMILRPLTNFELWTLIAGLIGAGFGLHAARGRLGHGGPGGLLQACGGMLMVCFIGSLVAGTLVLPLYGTMFGPFTLGLTLMNAPFLAMLWVFNLLAAHFAFGQWRRERETLFTPARLTPRASR